MKYLITLFVLISTSSFADSYYPKRSFSRPMGGDQGNVGDCQSEAEIAAIETAFLNRGNTVNLSLFYRHAANWSDDFNKLSDDKKVGLRLDLKNDDFELINRYGDFIPDFMWPEDGSGYDTSETGFRPRPSQVVINESELPHTRSFGFNKQFFTLENGYRNTTDYTSIKSAVASQEAIIIKLQSLIFSDQIGFFDHYTGLLKKRYDWRTLTASMKDLPASMSHAVVAIGFDDNLYSDQGYEVPGAIIIRNTWNDKDAVTGMNINPSGQQLKDLEKMKGRLRAKRLPGFYAIPYQYFIDLKRAGLGGWTKYSLDYDAYSKKYHNLQNKYTIMNLPYVCDRTRGAFKDSNYVRNQLAQLKYNESGLEMVAMNEITNRRVDSKKQLFKIAKMSKKNNYYDDRASDFYSGKYASYYCPGSGNVQPKLWPYQRHYQDERFSAALDQLQLNVSDLYSWKDFMKALIDMNAYLDQN